MNVYEVWQNIRKICLNISLLKILPNIHSNYSNFVLNIFKNWDFQLFQHPISFSLKQIIIIDVHMCTPTFTNIHTFTHTHTYTYSQTHTHTHRNIQYVRTHTQIHTHLYTHSQTHTHTHSH